MEYFTCVHTWFIFNAFSLLHDFFAKIMQLNAKLCAFQAIDILIKTSVQYISN